MRKNKIKASESLIIDELTIGRVSLPPLAFKLIETRPLIAGKYRLGAVVEGTALVLEGVALVPDGAALVHEGAAVEAHQVLLGKDLRQILRSRHHSKS